MFKCALALSLILACAGMTAAATGPVDQGSIYLNGSVFFQTQSGDLWEGFDSDGLTTIGAGNGNVNLNSGLEVAPIFGYFIRPGVFFGGQFVVIRYAQGDDDLTIFAVGPSLGYFYDSNPQRTSIKGAAYPYIRGFLNYGQFDSDVTILQYGAKGGLLYMLSEAVAADLGIQFRGDSWKPDGASKSTTGTTVNLGVGITAFIW